MTEKQWARVLAKVAGHRNYQTGAFATAMVEAAIVADSGNLARIGEGFPELVRVLSDWREYGARYVMEHYAGESYPAAVAV